MKGESWYGHEYKVRKSLAEAKDSQVREFYKAVEKDASNILRVCFPSEGCVMRQRIREIFGKSPHSEISKLRREYEEKVTAPIKESIETFSFQKTMNYFEIQLKEINDAMTIVKKENNNVDDNLDNKNNINYVEVKLEKDCGICLGDLDEKFTILQCGHMYCTECITAILNTKLKK